MNERICIILAAGKGSRLGLTDLPKVMVGVYDRPLLHHTMQTVESINPEKTIIVVGHKGDVIRNYFKDCVLYQEQVVLNGNAGALKEGLKAVTNPNTNLIILQGDDSAFYTTETLNRGFELHQNGRADITLLLTGDYDPNTFRTQYEFSSYPKVSKLLHPIKHISDGMFPTGSFIAKREVVDEILPDLKEISGVLSTTQLIMSCLEKGKIVLATQVPHLEWYGINNSRDLAQSHYLMSLRRSR